jgi:Domain of unknown function (DUF6894)
MEVLMPLYFFGLGNSPPPEQDGEDLPNHEEALKFAEEVAAELGRNSSERPLVSVFDAQRQPIVSGRG